MKKILIATITFVALILLIKLFGNTEEQAQKAAQVAAVRVVYSPTIQQRIAAKKLVEEELNTRK